MIIQQDLFGHDVPAITHENFTRCLICGKRLYDETIVISGYCWRNHFKELKKMLGKEKRKTEKISHYINKCKQENFRFIRISGDKTVYSIDQLPNYLIQNELNYYISLQTSNSLILIDELASFYHCQKEKLCSYIVFFRNI